MNIEYNLASLIDVLGLTQGLILGTILILGNRKNRPSLFLGLYLITYSAELFPSILEDIGMMEEYPFLEFIPLNFLFATQALLYVYTLSLIEKINIKRSLKILIPGILEFVILSVLFFIAINDVISIPNTLYGDIFELFYWLSGMAYSIVFVFKVIFRINKHQRQIEQFYSEVQQKHIKWIKFVAVFTAAFILTLIIGAFFFDNVVDHPFYLITTATNVIFIYWVGLSGFKQLKVDVPLLFLETPKKVKNLPDQLDQDYQVLLSFMEREKPYIKTDLTLADLSKAVDIRPKQLSHLINLKSGQNFNRFINQYRIDAAKEMLRDPDCAHLSVEGIGYEVGFNSKASFYSVFKAFTQTSPAQFKKRP